MNHFDNLLEVRPPVDVPTNWGEMQLLHLLRRSLVGVKRSDISAFQGLSKEEAVAKILTPVSFPDNPPINNYEVYYPDPNVPKGETWVNAVTGWALSEPNTEIEGGRIESAIYWLIQHIVEQSPSIHYKLILFWHNHLATEAFTVFAAKSTYQYFRMLWQLSLGNFKEMIKAITLDPCMLNYLNGTANNKEQPDENYARELQELFCIGKGPNAKFTESDVREAARVLTGWQLNWDSFYQEGEAEHRFGFWDHDEGDKQFSEFYGNRLIQGRSGEVGAEELDELIDMIVEHPECARFIVRKLYRFFVHSDINESVEASVIEPIAELFRASNYEIVPVMEALLLHDAFYERIGAGIKSPMDLMLGFWRSAEIQYPQNGDPVDEGFYTHQAMFWKLGDMGYSLGNPPNVSGWPAYYQFPSYDKLWISVTSLINRINVTDDFVRWGFWTPSEYAHWDYLAYTASFDNPQDPEALIEDMLRLHIAVPVDDAVRNRLKSILLSNQSNDYYWTDAWNNYISNPGDEMLRGIVEQRLKLFYLNLFQLPEYQLF